jgi:hypothetical protein
MPPVEPADDAQRAGGGAEGTEGEPQALRRPGEQDADAVVALGRQRAGDHLIRGVVPAHRVYGDDRAGHGGRRGTGGQRGDGVGRAR